MQFASVIGTGKPTCFGIGLGSELDFFLVSCSLQTVVRAEVDENYTLATHRPVSLQLRLEEQEELVLVRDSDLVCPHNPVFGPHWDGHTDWQGWSGHHVFFYGVC